jgi:3-deoxy-D-manno-octulosonic-acid transferase
MDNFREIRDIFIREQAALEVTSGEDLEYHMRQLLGDEARCRELGERARSLLDRNKGAARKTMEEVCRVVVVPGSQEKPFLSGRT